MKSSRGRGHSLIEITLAIAIVGIMVTALLALLPQGLSAA